MIDLSQAPYNVVGDWNRSDATATDNFNAIQDAAYEAAEVMAEHNDFGGASGDMIQLPKGPIMISQPIVLPDGVGMQGVSAYGTTLVAKQTLDPTKHVVTLGNPTSMLASFGGKIRDMNIWHPPNVDADNGAALVYTNNVQDVDAILQNIRLYGFKRQCFRGEIGYGGASIISLKQVTGNTNKPGVPAFHLDYGGSTMVNIDGIEPAGGRKNEDPNHADYDKPIDGTVGIYCRGGNFSIRRFHPEQCDYGILINLKNTDCFADIRHTTGGPATNHLFVIQNNPTQLNRIRFTNAIRNGVIGHMVSNGQRGASHIDSEIIDPIIL